MSFDSFYCLITNIRCTDLLSMDSNGFSDPYINVNFDNYEKFKVPKKSKTLNPHWSNYNHTFLYPTRRLRGLKKKKVTFQVMDFDALQKDDHIGTVSLTVHTLATGPISYELKLLTDDGKFAGTLYFDFVCKHITNSIAKVTKVGMDNLSHFDEDGKYLLKLEPISDVKYSGVESKTMNGSDLYMDALSNVIFEDISLQKFIRQGLSIRVYLKKALSKKLIGTASVNFIDYFKCYKQEGKEYKVALILRDNDNNQTGNISFYLSFAGYPKFAQLESGRMVGDKIEGVPLFNDIILPDGFVSKINKKQKPGNNNIGFPNKFAAYNTYAGSTATKDGSVNKFVQYAQKQQQNSSGISFGSLELPSSLNSNPKSTQFAGSNSMNMKKQSQPINTQQQYYPKQTPTQMSSYPSNYPQQAQQVQKTQLNYFGGSKFMNFANRMTTQPQQVSQGYNVGQTQAQNKFVGYYNQPQTNNYQQQQYGMKQNNYGNKMGYTNTTYNNQMVNKNSYGYGNTTSQPKQQNYGYNQQNMGYTQPQQKMGYSQPQQNIYQQNPMQNSVNYQQQNQNMYSTPKNEKKTEEIDYFNKFLNMQSKTKKNENLSQVNPQQNQQYLQPQQYQQPQYQQQPQQYQQQPTQNQQMNNGQASFYVHKSNQNKFTKFGNL